MSYPLPDPCPFCRGPVTYSGRGRRPVYCSAACREAVKVSGRRLRRERDRGRIRPADLDDPGARLESDGSRWAYSAEDLHNAARSVRDDDDREPANDGETLGYVPYGWATRQAKSRRKGKDPAADWLAQNHPAALADFPSAY